MKEFVEYNSIKINCEEILSELGGFIYDINCVNNEIKIIIERNKRFGDDKISNTYNKLSSYLSELDFICSENKRIKEDYYENISFK